MQAALTIWDQMQALDQMEVQDPIMLKQMEVLDQMEVQDQILLDLLEVSDQMEVQDQMLLDLLKGQDKQEEDKLEMVMEDHLDPMEEDQQATLLEVGQVDPL